MSREIVDLLTGRRRGPETDPQLNKRRFRDTLAPRQYGPVAAGSIPHVAGALWQAEVDRRQGYEGPSHLDQCDGCGWCSGAFETYLVPVDEVLICTDQDPGDENERNDVYTFEQRKIDRARATPPESNFDRWSRLDRR